MSRRQDSRSTGKLQVLLGFLLLAAIFFILVTIAWLFYQFFKSIDSGISVAIIAAAATVLVSVVSIVLGKIYESKQTIEREIRENKIPIYEELLGFMSRMLHGEKIGKKPTDEELVGFFIDFNQKMMVWGSDSVLIAWRDWRKTLLPGSAGSDSSLRLMLMMRGYEDIIYAIRKDLGHKNAGLGGGDLLRLFINDYDDFASGALLKKED